MQWKRVKWVQSRGTIRLLRAQHRNLWRFWILILRSVHLLGVVPILFRFTLRLECIDSKTWHWKDWYWSWAYQRCIHWNDCPQEPCIWVVAVDAWRWRKLGRDSKVKKIGWWLRGLLLLLKDMSHFLKCYSPFLKELDIQMIYKVLNHQDTLNKLLFYSLYHTQYIQYNWDQNNYKQ